MFCQIAQQSLSRRLSVSHRWTRRHFSEVGAYVTNFSKQNHHPCREVNKYKWLDSHTISYPYPEWRVGIGPKIRAHLRSRSQEPCRVPTQASEPCDSGNHTGSGKQAQPEGCCVQHARQQDTAPIQSHSEVKVLFGLRGNWVSFGKRKKRFFLVSLWGFQAMLWDLSIWIEVLPMKCSQ